MKNILLLNSISPVICDAFTEDYKFGTDIENPVGILLRSYKMHEYNLPESILAVARAGTGVNNIPIEEYANKGVVVFNTPGANANAVKELVVTALLLGSRKIVEAIEWTDTLKGKGEEISKLIEKGKSNFIGREILGKKLGVIGLGAIGALVANIAIDLGMQVIGYDPYLSVNGALRLSRKVGIAKDIEYVYKNCDYITLHIPYTSDNKDIINSDTIAKMKDGVVLINCARGELVNNEDIIKATEDGKVDRYVVDFPVEELIGKENIICIPHLGASTPEAEDNCAFKATRQLMEYIENGNIINSVNYPNCSMPNTTAHRLVILHKNINNILAQITGTIGSKKINIENLANTSKGSFAVTLINTDSPISEQAVKHLESVDGIIKVRVIN